MPDVFVPSEKKEEKDEGILSTSHGQVHHLATFYENPLGLKFKNQEEDEKILLFLRKHIVTNIPWIFLGVILILLPISFFFIFPFLQSSLAFIGGLSTGAKTILFLFYYLIVFNYLLISFITWYFNVSLVTNKRVVDIDFSDLVYHDVAITKLSLIEDVNYTQTGFLRSFFNYGDVYVQTAGEARHFDFLGVPNPSRVVHVIQELIGRRRESH